MKIYRAFAAAFVALLLLTACTDDPVADARAAVERAKAAVLQADLAKEFALAKEVNASTEKILEDAHAASTDALLAAYNAAKVAAIAPTKYAAKQRAIEAHNAAATAESAAKIVKATVLSVYPAYNADDALDYITARNALVADARAVAERAKIAAMRAMAVYKYINTYKISPAAEKTVDDAAFAGNEAFLAAYNAAQAVTTASTEDAAKQHIADANNAAETAEASAKAAEATVLSFYPAYSGYYRYGISNDLDSAASQAKQVLGALATRAILKQTND